MKRLIGIGLAMMSVGLLAACGTNEEEQASEPSINVVPIGDFTTHRLPLDAYLPSREQQATLQNARNQLQLVCLRRFGFDFDVPVVTPKPVGRNERRYGITDEQFVARYAYNEPRIDNRERPDEEKLSEAAKAVLTGQGASSHQGKPIPEGGCLGEALRTLGEGAPKADESLAEELSAESLHKSEKDSRTLAAFADWRTCMSKAGYSYSGPREPGKDPQFRGEVAGDREIQIALADIQCRKSTNLLNIWAAVDAAYQTRAIEERGEELTMAKKLLEVKLRNASRLVGK